MLGVALVLQRYTKSESKDVTIPVGDSWYGVSSPGGEFHFQTARGYRTCITTDWGCSTTATNCAVCQGDGGPPFVCSKANVDWFTFSTTGCDYVVDYSAKIYVQYYDPVTTQRYTNTLALSVPTTITVDESFNFGTQSNLQLTYGNLIVSRKSGSQVAFSGTNNQNVKFTQAGQVFLKFTTSETEKGTPVIEVMINVIPRHTGTFTSCFKESATRFWLLLYFLSNH